MVDSKKIKDRESVWIDCGSRVEKVTHELRVMNVATQKLPRPAISFINVTVDCRYPTEVRIQGVDSNLDKGHLYLTKEEPFLVEVVGYDSEGRRFLNNSNL